GESPPVPHSASGKSHKNPSIGRLAPSATGDRGLAIGELVTDIGRGRLVRTCSSPTGSGPEGSSPNETFTGRCQPPTSPSRRRKTAAPLCGQRSRSLYTPHGRHPHRVRGRRDALSRP